MNNIAKYRKRKGLTQKELASELNVTAGAVGMWEMGKRRPDIDKAKNIADYFETSIENIFFAQYANEMIVNDKDNKAS